MDNINAEVINWLGTALLVLLAVEMLARVAINTWFEVLHLIVTNKTDFHVNTTKKENKNG